MLTGFLMKGGILAVLMALAGLAGLWVWFDAGRDARVFANGAVTVEATVSGKRTRERIVPGSNALDRIRETEHFITLDYTTGSGGASTAHSVERQVSEGYWAGVTRGGAVTIRHLPDAPETIEVEAGTTATQARWAGLAGGGLLILGLALGGFLWRRTAQGVNLARDGVQATGEVTGVRHVQGFSFLQYRFTDSAGVVHSGQSKANEDGDFSDRPPGSAVGVVYDRANPTRHALSQNVGR